MKKIVLVEDDASIRETFAIVFKKDKYDLTSLEKSDSIINNEIEAPDLFILDKQLSGIDGLDLCRFVKSSEKYKHVCVIMLSASSSIIALANHAGADDAITKPFVLKNLREIVSKLIG